MNSQRNLSAFCVVFGVVFSLAYLLAVWKNYALFTYHPAIGAFAWGAEKAREGGPAMYWYGFVITAALGALVVTGLAALIPDKLMERIPWAGVTWVVTLCSIAYIAYILLPYATKT